MFSFGTPTQLVDPLKYFSRNYDADQWGRNFRDVGFTVNFYGNVENNAFYGDDKADFMWGYGGSDNLFGGGGNDQLYGGNNNDFLYGGDGDDIIGTGSGQDWAYGGNGNDTLIAGEGNINILYGGAGNDHLTAGGDRSLLYGGNGNDRFSVREGEATIDGGTGSDAVSFQQASASIEVDLKQEEGAIGGDQMAIVSVENVTGSDQDDVLWGNDVRNVLRGRDGDDDLRGFGGDDYLFGENGSDTIDGGTGQDRIYGGLNTATEQDSLRGGADADTFVFFEGNSGGGGLARDVIHDFDQNGDDIMEFRVQNVVLASNTWTVSAYDDGAISGSVLSIIDAAAPGASQTLLAYEVILEGINVGDITADDIAFI